MKSKKILICSLKISNVSFWPGERDSNPRRCYPQRFSRPPLSTTQPSPDKIKKLEATPRFELGNQSFAGSCLTAWLCRHFVVPGAGLEPARTQCPRDFKSLVSTIPPPGHFESYEKSLTFYDFNMERETGIEPAAPTLARLCSTTELLPHKMGMQL